MYNNVYIKYNNVYIMYNNVYIKYNVSRRICRTPNAKHFRVPMILGEHELKSRDGPVSSRPSLTEVGHAISPRKPTSMF